jgi:RsmE family RNA methyltransferase
MNLLLFSQQDRLEGNRIRLSDHRLQHLHSVIKANEGDSLRVGEINGRMGQGELLRISREEAIVEVNLDREPPAKLPLTLVLALPRPKMLRRILRMIAEMGVAELHLINSYRVEKSYWQTPVLDSAVVEDYFLQGLSQSRDTILPTLQLHKRFKPFVEDQLPTVIADKRALLAHPGDHPGLSHGIVTPTLLVIGPEGGFIPYEVEMLQAAGCDTVSLGPRILRVENAVSSLIARMST